MIDDITGALWVFDESHEPKDSRGFHKKANVPIVMIANKQTTHERSGTL